MKRELRIDVPVYEGRREDLNTIAMIAGSLDLDYNAMTKPCFTVSDAKSEEVILESYGVIQCFVSGEEENIEKFLEELKNWIS